MRIILIRWPATETIETVDALVGPSQQDNEIRQTTDFWPEGNEHYDYKTTSQRIIKQNGSQTTSIHYSQEDNPDWEFGWGTSTITISRDLNSAKAVWKGDFDTKYDGQGQCTVFPKAPLAEKEREEVSRIKRRQDEFRDFLFCRDRCCAITGEKTRAALDAAHIVAVADNGPESPDNGILLRADLHRLYDARFFEILQDGCIEFTVEKSSTLSKPYRKILKIVGRVKESLAKRTRSQ